MDYANDCEDWCGDEDRSSDSDPNTSDREFIDDEDSDVSSSEEDDEGNLFQLFYFNLTTDYSPATIR